MPVKGSYLLLAGGAGILVWSGLRGKSWSQVLRTLISGKPPSATLDAYTIQGAPAVTANLPGVSGPSGPGENAFWIAVLASLLAPPTPANINSLISWRTHECPWNNQPPDGAGYTHNPLNTTLNMPGAVSINSVGVKKYPDALIGIAATRMTLSSGYPGIVAALRSGRGLCGSGLAGEFSKWSGGGYSSVC